MRPQSGFSLILAVFLLVTLTAMGTYLLTISTSQSEASIADTDGTRAYFAARSGIDWGAFQLLRNTGGAFATACDGGATSQTLTFAGELAGFAAGVSCSSLGVETEGALSVRLFQLLVTACNQGACPGTPGPGYVERQLLLTVAR